MTGSATVRIALANVRIPETPDESVALAAQAIADAGAAGALVVCFPEAYVPGYRIGRHVPPPDTAFLERAWAALADASAQAGVTTILGTERIVDDGLRLTAHVITADGTSAGFQDKVQLDPSEDEDDVYRPGAGRRVFRAGALVFGIAICHEGFRYPETVRWAAREGAQIVFHPHFVVAEPGGYRATTYAEQGNTFHEKALLCRAAENTCWIATVNCASAGSPTTSAVVRPDGTVLAYQPYGEASLLVADIDLTLATGLLARRYRPV